MTGLFDGVLTRGPIGPLTDDTAWLGALLEAEAALARALATLVADHRLILMPGRTLLQQTLSITFGAVTAGWAAGSVATLMTTQIQEDRKSVV